MTTPLSPRLRILALFLAGIAAPSGLLGYLAFRGIQNDQALLERERRADLERIAYVVGRDFEDRLSKMAADESTAGLTDGGVPELRYVPPGPTDAVAAILHVTVSGDVEPLVTGPVLGRVSNWADGVTPPVLTSAEWERSQVLEFRDRSFSTALEGYEQVLKGAPPALHGTVLAAIARTQRKAGRPVDAATTFRTILNEHGDERTPAGTPLGPAAALELASLLLEARDTTAAVRELAYLYGGLIRGEWVLTTGQLEFFLSQVRRELRALLPGTADATPTSPTAPMGGRAPTGAAEWVDSLVVLEAEEAARRKHSEWLSRLQGAISIGSRSTPPEGHFLLEMDGRSIPVSLRQAIGGGTWVTVFDPRVLASDLLQPMLEEKLPADIALEVWARGGELLAGSTDPDPGPLLLAVNLPGDFPPWTLRFHLRDPGLANALLTSRRGVYFYAFVLIAGILVFGLVLTIRSVNHELRLARLQADFVSTVSHEFKSPLTAIRQLSEMLRDGRVPSEDRRRQYHDVLLNESERLSALVDDVLDLVKMDDGRRPLELEVVPVGELIERVVRMARNRYAHLEFVIHTSIDEPLPEVRADRAALGQALENLIDNAVKYSGDSREVRVAAHLDGRDLMIEVQDFGIGLQPEELDRVFDRFYRAGASLTREVKGTGLGLTLVRQITEAHRGRVEVKSAPGRGSTFSLRLPAPVPAGPRNHFP